MSTYNKILSGLNYLKKTKNNIKKKIFKFKNNFNKKPYINILQIGNNKSSKLFIEKKCKIFKHVGIKYKIYNLNKNIKEIKIIKLIKKININKKIHCLLIQLPLPKNINYYKIINSINPKKDVDGLHFNNIGKLIQGYPYIRSCVSYGVIKLFKIYKINIFNLNTVIINSSNLIGKPLSLELLNKGCTVTLINKKTQNMEKYIKNADLLITAIGKYNIFPIKWIKKNSIVIDIGITLNKKNKIIGDINYKLAIKRVKYITPVPGGIGPMTISILLKNIIKIFKIYISNI